MINKLIQKRCSCTICSLTALDINSLQKRLDSNISKSSKQRIKYILRTLTRDNFRCVKVRKI